MVSLEESVAAFVNQEVIGLRRVHYVGPDGEIYPNGALELRFRAGNIVVFDCSPNGQDLRLTEGPWEDPWAPPLDEETVKFLEESGRPRVFDVSRVSPYSRLLGVISEAEPGHTVDGLGEVPEIVELTLEIANSRVRLHTEAADELFVDIDGELVDCVPPSIRTSTIRQ